MKHILPYSESSDSQLISKYFQDKEQVITSALAVENLTWEANLLNSVESVLSEDLAFDLHFDMIIDGGRDAIQEYYKQITLGSNTILERAKSYTNDLESINESIDLLKQQVKQRALQFLNEQAISLGGLDVINQVNQLLSKPASVPAAPKAPAPGVSAPAAPSELDASFDKALGGAKPASAEGDWSSWSGVYTKVKNLLSAITEGGSPIGVLHLLLDLASFIPEIGPLFDIINACIYFYRANQPENANKGMWLLGTISLVSGIMFGTGQMFKLFKPAAKETAVVMKAMEKGGSKAGVEVISKLPAAKKGLVMRFLSFLAKNVGIVVGKATSILGKATEKIIGKLSSYIPFIGKPLEKVFGMIGTTLSKYGEKMAKFSKDFAEVEKGAAKTGAEGAKATAEVAAKESVTKMMEKGGIMEIDSKGVVTILDSEGKELGRFSKELLTDVKAWESKAPGLFAKGEEELVASYFNGAAKSEKLSALAFTTKFFRGVAKTAKLSTKFMIFLGKQVIKLMYGESALAPGKYTDKELEYWGNSAFNSYMDARRKKEEKESGAVYKPDVILDSSEEEAFEHVTKYQQNYAKMTGQPDIITAVYDKYGSQGTEEQFKDFWDSVAEGETKRGDENDKVEHDSEEEPSNESFTRMKHITSFSKFQLG